MKLYVTLSIEGMNLVNENSPGPFEVTDHDPQWGVEIRDSKNIHHWIMKGKYTFLEGHTLTGEIRTFNHQKVVDKVIEEEKQTDRSVHFMYDDHVDLARRIATALIIIKDLPQSVYHMKEIDDIRHVLKGKPVEGGGIL